MDNTIKVQNYSPYYEANRWQTLKQRFIDLGGRLDNIEIGIGCRGRGLFCVNQCEQVRLLCPKNLLLPASHIEIINDEVTINLDRQLYPEEYAFLKDYYQDFAWKDGGFQETKAFFLDLWEFPKSIKSYLEKYLILNISALTDDPTSEILFTHFMLARHLSYFGDIVLAPMLDLLNQSPFTSQFLTTNSGLEIHRNVINKDKEILHKYTPLRSSLGVWAQYGFAAQQPFCYSFPLELKLAFFEITLVCEGDTGNQVQEYFENVHIEDDRIVIKSLPIGCMSSHLPFYYLRRALSFKGVNEERIAELLFNIQSSNMKERQALIDDFRGKLNRTSQSFIDTLKHEIKLIDHSLSHGKLNS